MIVAGANLTDVLEHLCTEIAAQSPDVMSSVMLMDPDGKRLWPKASQRVSKEWLSAIAPLPIGPRMGSCGTAAFRKQRVINPDIVSDPVVRMCCREVPRARFAEWNSSVGMRRELT